MEVRTAVSCLDSSRIAVLHGRWRRQSRSQDAKTSLVAPHLTEKITMLLALSTISGAVVQPALLDPLSLVNNKALQATTLLPYRPPAENNGLSTATLALG